MPEIDRSNLTEAELEALLYHLATQSDEDDDKLILEYEDFFDAQLDASSQEPPLEEWERHLDEL